MNIFQRINAVMKDIDYIKRGSAGQGTGVLYDEVIAGLQPLLVEHGIVVAVDFIADTSRTNPKGSYIYEGYFDVHYINIDKPEDKLTCKIVAHAMDSGDKAPGKAITYACKIAHLKTFGYETGENDESRVAEENCDSGLSAIKGAESMEHLKEVYAWTYKTFPKSRKELTAAKDARKKELADAAE